MDSSRIIECDIIARCIRFREEFNFLSFYIELLYFLFNYHNFLYFLSFAGAGTSETTDRSRAFQCGALLSRAGQHILGSQLSQSESLRDPAGPGQKRRLRRGTEQYSAHRNDSHSKFTTQDGKFSLIKQQSCFLNIFKYRRLTIHI